MRSRIGGGLVVFGVCSAYGLRLIYRGATHQIIDSNGMETAPRWLFIGGGCVMQIPLIAFIAYLVHQGFF